MTNPEFKKKKIYSSGLPAEGEAENSASEAVTTASQSVTLESTTSSTNPGSSTTFSPEANKTEAEFKPLKGKQVFSEQEANFTPDADFAAEANAPVIEEDKLKDFFAEDLDLQVERSLKSKLFTRFLYVAICLILLAFIFRNIRVLFTSITSLNLTATLAIVGFTILWICIAVIIYNEVRILYQLKSLEKVKQNNEQFIERAYEQESPEFNGRLQKHLLDGDQTIAWCLMVAAQLNVAHNSPLIENWEAKLTPYLTPKQIIEIFEQEVLKPIDQKALKLIEKTASVDAAVVAVSPYATIDILFVLWRNILLINKISAMYGIEVSFTSRLSLLKNVLLNVAISGVTEGIQDLAHEHLASNLVGTISAKVGQGLGIGLLTARLGIKTMEMIRPIKFKPEQKPRVHQVFTALFKNLPKILKSKAPETGK